MEHTPPPSPERHRTRSPSRRTHPAVVAATVLGLALSAALAPGATAAPSKKAPAVVKTDVREIAPNKSHSTKQLTLKSSARAKVRAQAEAAGTPPVGTTRTLLALNDYQGFYYLKPYTLQAVGAHIEVWVADDTAFPAGDCRDQVADSTTVTRAQAQELATQFDTNMFPKESQAFSVAPDRDGSANVVGGVDPSGDGNKIMTLVDNVRDDNYYEGVNVAPTYIAGFFSSQINELLDRNVMTIDAYDWVHRTTANPPDATTTDLCTSRPARPYLYEGCSPTSTSTCWSTTRTRTRSAG